VSTLFVCLRVALLLELLVMVALLTVQTQHGSLPIKGGRRLNGKVK